MKYRIALAAFLLVGGTYAPTSANAQPQSVARSSEDLNWIAAYAYQASQTHEAFKRQANANLVAARRQIDELVRDLDRLTTRLASERGDRRRLERETDSLRQEIARQSLNFTRRLAERDERYAQEREILLTTGEKLMSTPRGRKALELWLKGGPEAYQSADDVLAEEQAARARAREQVSREELSADIRERVVLALDAFDKGATRREVVLKLQEQLVGVGVPKAWDLLGLARSYSDLGRYREAVVASERALSVARTPSERSTALNDAGSTLRLMGDSAGASARFVESLKIMRESAAGKPAGSPELSDLAVALIYAGDMEMGRGRHADALARYREALSTVRGQLATASPTDNDRRNESVSLMRIGDLLFETEGCPKALPSYAEGLEARRRYAAAAHDSLSGRRSLMIALGAVGSTEVRCGDKASALDLLDKGVELARELAAKNPGSSVAQRDLAVSLGQLGDGLALTGDRRAIAVYEEALTIDRRLLAADSGLAQALNDVADDLFRLADIRAPGHSWAEVAAHYDTMHARRVEPASPEQKAAARIRAREEARSGR